MAHKTPGRRRTKGRRDEELLPRGGCFIQSVELNAFARPLEEAATEIIALFAVVKLSETIFGDRYPVEELQLLTRAFLAQRDRGGTQKG